MYLGGGAMVLHEHFLTDVTQQKIEASAENDDVMLISEVAAAVGLEPKTIRFYERARLVEPKKHGRIRIFRGKDLARLIGIKKLRQYGISLSTMRSILASEGDLTLASVHSPEVQKLLMRHLVEMNRQSEFIQVQIADLKARLGRAEQG
jgi:DNA-binding transcriptional MerR regulator